MPGFTLRTVFLLLVVTLAGLVGASQARAEETVMLPEGEVAEDVMVIDMEAGQIMIRLLPDVAPQHVAQIKALVREGFYDGIVFHRVIDGFMAQTGDPTGTGMGRSEKPDIPAEFSSVPFDRGIVGMARSSMPDSANSQFFIMFAPGHFLNGNYTVFGKVIKGMDVVDGIKRGEPPADPDKMMKVRIASDNL